MRRAKQKLFNQLDDSRQARPSAKNLWKQLYPERPSGFKRNTVGYLADQLPIPVQVLIEQFEKAGIAGLTPDHKISELDKRDLLNYLRASHKSQSRELYVDKKPAEHQIVLVQDITNELLVQLARQPSLIHELGPRRFEELVARLLEDQGCDVTLTKLTRDGGFDIFGRIRGSVASPMFLVECKHYAPHRKVGVEVVRGLYAVTEMRRANLGLVITSSSFTKDAHDEKIRIGDRIELKEFDHLCTWLAQYRVAG